MPINIEIVTLDVSVKGCRVMACGNPAHIIAVDCAAAMTEKFEDHRETIAAAMRAGARLRIRYVPLHDDASEHVILPRDWTYGSTFFAWDFMAKAHRTFDAHFIVACASIDADANVADERDAQRRARPAPPGRSGDVLPPVVLPPRIVRRRSRAAYPAAAVLLLAAAGALWVGADSAVPPLQRIFGTPTPAPTITATASATPTATVDLRAMRAATATAAAVSRLATEESPCHPRSGICFDIDGRTLVLAIPPDARLLVYARPQLDPSAARAAMRHHIRSVEARDPSGEWLLLRMTDGEALWVQAAAVGVRDARDVVPEWAPSATPARPTTVRRRTPTPQP
jgi:hypothetical protein